MQKLKRIFVFLLSVILVFSCTFTAFADWRDLIIRTDSNASTFAVTRSSLGTVTNTVEGERVLLSVGYTDRSTGNTYWVNVYPDYVDGRFEYRFECLDGYYISRMYFRVTENAIPPTGTYELTFDHSSDFSITYKVPYIYSRKYVKNASYLEKTDVISDYFVSASGDCFVGPLTLQINNIYQFDIRLFPSGTNLTQISGSFSWRFSPVDTEPDFTTVGSGMQNSDYQSDVSSSLSDLSSSVDEVSDEIGFVAEAIQNLQGAMEPHYNNVLTQLHHITEQLHAFWDQQFNLHHVPLMAKLSDIIESIGNMDLEVEVNLNSLKTSIDTMSQNVQNKLQSVSDTITGGYDNSGIESENDELSGAVDELDQAEKEVLDDVTGYIEGFEYPSFDNLSGGLLGAISFFGGYLQSMFLAMGDFGLIITFSLTMIFVLIIVGYHRIRT